jgi:hypothetical protein
VVEYLPYKLNVYFEEKNMILSAKNNVDNVKVSEISHFIDNLVSKIKLSEKVKEHILYTEQELLEFTAKLNSFSETSAPIFVLDCNINEERSSSDLERATYSNNVLNLCEKYDICCNKKYKITDTNLFMLNNAIIEDNDYSSNPQKYRDCIAWFGRPGCSLEEARDILTHPKFVESLMEQFLTLYNNNAYKEISHPFIKGAVDKIIFVKIHPFKDGNGRMSRILHQHKLTEMFNEKHNLQFTMPIINLSQHYRLLRGGYYQNILDILFDDEIDNNLAWNKWFDYILNLMDENIFFLNRKLDYYTDSMYNIDNIAKKKVIR